MHKYGKPPADVAGIVIGLTKKVSIETNNKEPDSTVEWSDRASNGLILRHSHH